MNQSTETPRTAAIYVRVSTAKQEDEGTSLASQEAACRAYAAEQGYTVTEVYTDVHTGTDFFERPALSELREVIRRGDVAAVICYDLDRLSRDAVHLGVLFTEAHHHGVAVELVLGAYDDSLESQTFRFIKGIAGKIEHERLKDRSRRGREGRLAKGRPLVGPRPPYGYQWADDVKSRLIADPITAPILQRIFRDVAGGISARQVTLALTREGVPTPSGGHVWCAPTIGKLLRHPVYAGTATAMRWENYAVHVPHVGRKVRNRKRDASAHQVFPDVAPALVDPATIDEALRRLPLNKLNATRNTRDPEATLLRGGVAVCADCGKALGLHWVKKLPYYICTQKDRYGCAWRNISVTKLDAATWERVEAVLTDPTLIARELERQRADDPTVGDVEAVGRRLAEVERRQQTLVRGLALADDEDVAALVQGELKTLAAHARQLKAEQEALGREREGWRLAQGRLDDLDAWCRNVAANIEGLTYDQKRLALEALGVQVRLWPTGHTPRYEIAMAVDVVETTDWRS